MSACLWNSPGYSALTKPSISASDRIPLPLPSILEKISSRSSLSCSMALIFSAAIVTANTLRGELHRQGEPIE